MGVDYLYFVEFAPPNRLSHFVNYNWPSNAAPHDRFLYSSVSLRLQPFDSHEVRHIEVWFPLGSSTQVVAELMKYSILNGHAKIVGLLSTSHTLGEYLWCPLTLHSVTAVSSLRYNPRGFLLCTYLIRFAPLDCYPLSTPTSQTGLFVKGHRRFCYPPRG